MGWWPVLFLDEPTEWLAPDTAAAVLADILGAACGRTTLLVTHERAGRKRTTPS
ncbi:hypothetical protein [Streptomyces durhamensis]|uniref:hypothetical protein n=1 Tax=Streptomyces durhamensis TaxID=68194 RepID=UPI000B206E3D|nr:hypothetical protein [Streptomyces durhamensis]